MKRLLVTIPLALPLAVPAQEFIEFENGQVADAGDLNQNLQFLLQKIEALEARVTSLEPPPLPLDLDEDGIPNNAIFNAEDLASLFLSSRPIAVSGDKITVSGGGAVKNERLWEFALPEGFNLEAYSELSVTVDIQMEKANGLDSDFALGITDETKIMVFVNNDAGNSNSQVFDGNIFISGGVTSHDEINAHHFSIPGTERDNYRVGFTLKADSVVVDILDLNSIFQDQQAVIPEQLLETGDTYKIAVHANEVHESYIIRSISISFPSELVDQD